MATIQSIEAVEDGVETDNGEMFAFWVVVDEDENDNGGRYRVLAKSKARWAPGDEVEITVVNDQRGEGPDGEEGWLYARFKKPDDDGNFDKKKSGGFKGKAKTGGFKSKSATTPKATTGATPTKTEPKVVLSASNAVKAFDTFLTSSIEVAVESVGKALARFEGAKAGGDTILREVMRGAYGRACSLFGAYSADKSVSFGPAAANGKAKPEAKAVEERAEEDAIPF